MGLASAARLASRECFRSVDEANWNPLTTNSGSVVSVLTVGGGDMVEDEGVERACDWGSVSNVVGSDIEEDEGVERACDRVVTGMNV